MTDEDLATIRADAAEAARVLNGGLTVVDSKLAVLTVSYAEEYATLTPKLLDEIERLRAREAALVEVVRAVARFDDDNAYDGAYKCHWCSAMYDGVGDRPAPHTADCPVTKARALLGAGRADAQDEKER